MDSAPIAPFFSTPGGRLLVVAVLMALNAFFVAAEFAFVRVRATRLKQLAAQGNLRAASALTIHAQMDSYLSACQLGVTLASLGLGWAGEPAVAAIITPLLAPLFSAVGLQESYLHLTALVVGFAAITSVHIVLGEQAPKVFAIQRAEAVALPVALPLRAFHALAYPFIYVLNEASNAVCRLLGVDPASGHTEVHSGEELKMILHQSREGGAIGRSEGDVVTRALDLSRRMVREVMVPRGEVVFLNIQRPLAHNLQVARESGFTRFPLCDGDLDRVRGTIHLRELLEKVAAQRDTNPGQGAEVDLRALARKGRFMPEQMTLTNALREFQRSRAHQAVVVDEYGGTVGLLTLEDVLEALVGPIQDEFDEEAPLIQGMGKGVVKVDGSTPLAEVNSALGLTVQDVHNGTLGGHLTMLLGRLAQVGDRVRLGPYDVVVEQMAGLAVGTVSFVPRAETPTAPRPDVTRDTGRKGDETVKGV
jgi:CBS domain containing-hemolysin-like protein